MLILLRLILFKRMKKKKYELDIDQYTFISNCRDFLIQPIADKSIYYGVLSLYFKFTQIVQDIAIKKRMLITIKIKKN